MVEHLGADVFASVAVDGAELPVIVRLDGDSAVRPGLAVGLTFDPARAHPFDAPRASGPRPSTPSGSP